MTNTKNAPIKRSLGDPSSAAAPAEAPVARLDPDLLRRQTATLLRQIEIKQEIRRLPTIGAVRWLSGMLGRDLVPRDQMLDLADCVNLEEADIEAARNGLWKFVSNGRLREPGRSRH